MQKNKSYKISVKDSFFNFLEAMFISLAIIGLVFWLIGQPLEITGSSMYPTFEDGEQIIAEKITFKLQTPDRGDIVIFRHPEHKNVLAIKRIVGMPFDRFLIQDGKIFIDGEEYNEPYLNNINTQGKSKIPDNLEIFVPEDAFVVLGDNREDSLDSRVWGFIDRKDIVAKPFAVYLPTQNFRLVY